MLFMEEAAKKKMCCRAYPQNVDIQMFERAGGHRCIASDCMAWRWIKGYPSDTINKLGYCGLAGSPEPLKEYSHL